MSPFLLLPVKETPFQILDLLIRKTDMGSSIKFGLIAGWSEQTGKRGRETGILAHRGRGTEMRKCWKLCGNWSVKITQDLEFCKYKYCLFNIHYTGTNNKRVVLKCKHCFVLGNVWQTAIFGIEQWKSCLGNVGIGSDKTKGKFHTIPYHTIPHHTTPYHNTLYHTIPCYWKECVNEAIRLFKCEK